MQNIILECNKCHQIFTSGIAMEKGASAKFIKCKSQCPFCGACETIPNGTFKVSLEGVLEVLNQSNNPLEDAKKILDGLNKAKKGQDYSNNPQKNVIENFFKNHKYTVGVIIVILKIIINLLTANPSIEINKSIVDNNFFNTYNQYIEINNIEDDQNQTKK